MAHWRPDDTGAEEPHTGHHISDDLGRPGVAVEVHPDVYERGGSDSHQCVRSQPPLVAVLPFGPDQGAEDERCQETDERVHEIADTECVQKCHLKRSL
jgi:hypothetical protein